MSFECRLIVKETEWALVNSIVQETTERLEKEPPKKSPHRGRRQRRKSTLESGQNIKQEIDKDNSGVKLIVVSGRTALRHAILDSILKSGKIDVNLRANGLEDGLTALHFAAAQDKAVIVELLLQYGANNTYEAGPYKQLPLHLACQRTDDFKVATRVVSVLLNSSAKNVRLVSDTMGNLAITYAVKAKNARLVELLLSKYSSQQGLEWREMGSGNAHIHLAARNRDIKTVRVLVGLGSADVNARNGQGETPLHVSAQLNDIEMLYELYKMKANPRIPDINDTSPLQAAVAFSTSDSGDPIIQYMMEITKSEFGVRTLDGSTLLHLAATAGNVAGISALLNKNVSLNMANKDGFQALHSAAYNGHILAVERLLDEGVNINILTKLKMTPLHLAVSQNQPEMVDMLIARGAKVNLRGGKHWETPLHISARKKTIECCRLLLLSGADANEVSLNDETALHIAARKGYGNIVRLLLYEQANRFALNKNGETPLQYAVRYTQLEIVKILVLDHYSGHSRYQGQRLASLLVNHGSYEGETALHLACEYPGTSWNFDELDIAMILLRNGANMELITKLTAETAIHYCARVGNIDIMQELSILGKHKFSSLVNKRAKDGRTPLLVASDCGHDLIVKFLCSKNARVDLFDNSGVSALHLAAQNGSIETCETLLRYKAFVNVRTRSGYTSLHVAAQNGYKDLVALMIEKYHAVVNATALDRKTPLHLAAEYGHQETAEVLIKLGGNLTALDQKGQMPIHLAAKSDNPEVVKMFLNHKPELVFTSNRDGQTCAHIAASNGSVAVIKQLRRFNREIVTTTKNYNGSLPLHMAAEEGHADVTELLIGYGSSPLTENSDGMSSIHLASKEGHTSVLRRLPSKYSWNEPSYLLGWKPIHFAAFYNRHETIGELMRKVTPDTTSRIGTKNPNTIEDPNIRKLISIDGGLTALHVSCYAGHDQIVRLLLNNPRVQVDVTSQILKLTGLHYASLAGNASIASLLLARSSLLLQTPDSRGMSPLHLASKEGNQEMISNLIGQGAEIDDSDNKGWTPLHHAAKEGKFDAVKLLIELGADATRVCKEPRDVIPLHLAANAKNLELYMYLLNFDFNWELVIKNDTFIEDLVFCGRLSDQAAIEEFVLRSSSPLDCSVNLSKLFLTASTNRVDSQKEFVLASRFAERMANRLLDISSFQAPTVKILQAHDSSGKQFIDVLIADDVKRVVADPQIQRYLTDLWHGGTNRSHSYLRTTGIFFLFVFCPFASLIATLPLGHAYDKIPQIKFLAKFASHIHFIVVIFTVAVVPLYPLPERDDLWPTWNEVVFLCFLAGNLVTVLRNLSVTSGSDGRVIRIVILAICSIGTWLHVAAIFLDIDSYAASLLMYLRNIVFSIPVLLSVIDIIEYFTFHHRFGPLVIILRYIVEETIVPTSAMLIFFIGWWLQLGAAYSPLCQDAELDLTEDCICNIKVPQGCDTPYVNNREGHGIPGCRSNSDHVGILTTNFQFLYGSLVHHGDHTWQPAVRNTPEWVFIFIQTHLALFHIVMVLTMTTIITATSADTYERMSRRSDREWKFERAKLIRSVARSTSVPSPFNLVTEPLFSLVNIVRRWRKLASEWDSASAGLLRMKMFSNRYKIMAVSGFQQQFAGSNNKNAILHTGKLEEVIDWKLAVERYREIRKAGFHSKEDEYIPELGHKLGDLEEWQQELWAELDTIEVEKERENYRIWLIEEFKEVIIS